MNNLDRLRQLADEEDLESPPLEMLANAILDLKDLTDDLLRRVETEQEMRAAADVTLQRQANDHAYIEDHGI